MLTLYPQMKKLLLLMIAVCFLNNINAQQNVTYAAVAVKSENINVESVVRIKARTQNKVLLSWAPLSDGVSHYVLERSINNRSFYEAGMFFTSENGVDAEYVFTDHLRVNYSGTLYYRLRVIGLNGSEEFTPVTKVSGGMASLLTH